MTITKKTLEYLMKRAIKERETNIYVAENQRNQALTQVTQDQEELKRTKLGACKDASCVVDALWRRDHTSGSEEACKDASCVVVYATDCHAAVVTVDKYDRNWQKILQDLDGVLRLYNDSKHQGKWFKL